MIKSHQGFVALSAVLILTAVFLAIAIGLSTKSISGQDTAVVIIGRDKAKYLAYSCLEYARMELIRSLDYQGNEVIMLTDGLCEINQITGIGNFARVLRIKAVVDEYSYYIEDNIETINPIMQINTSQRVEGF